MAIWIGKPWWAPPWSHDDGYNSFNDPTILWQKLQQTKSGPAAMTGNGSPPGSLLGSPPRPPSAAIDPGFSPLVRSFGPRHPIDPGFMPDPGLREKALSKAAGQRWRRRSVANIVMERERGLSSQALAIFPRCEA